MATIQIIVVGEVTVTRIQPIAAQAKPLTFEGTPRFEKRIIPRFEGGTRIKNLPNGISETFEDVVVVGGARTPFGRVGGDLKDVSATDLLRIAMKGAMEKAGVNPETMNVKQVIVGNIIANKPNQSFMPRVIAASLGIPMNTSIAHKGDRLCGTGFDIARQAAEQVSNGGEDAVIITGGVESMSRTPVMDTDRMLIEEYLKGLNRTLEKKGGQMGFMDRMKLKAQILAVKLKLTQHKVNLDYGKGPLNDGLTDPNADIMIATADELSRRWGISRQDVDDYAFESHQRYFRAMQEGRFKDEIVPVKQGYIKEGRISKKLEAVDKDGLPRPAGKDPKGARAKLGKLDVLNENRQDAVHTAANASGIVDGAAAVAISSGVYAAEKNLPILAKLKSVAVTGCDPGIMGFGPATAIPAALDAANLTLDDMDYVEVNEAFAGQVLAVAKALVKGADASPEEKKAAFSVEEQNKFDALMAKLNVDGGGISIGHPLAATGSRIITHAANRLRDDNKRYAVVSACIGGGQGIAMVLENPAYKPE